MKLRLNSTQAFTLPEVLVSLLIVAIIGAASWTAVSVLSPTSVTTEDQIEAANLLTLSQEEVYRAAQNQFDTLDQCTFAVKNACGFADITTQFPGFNRTLNFVGQGTSELKKAHIQVSWHGPTGVLRTQDAVFDLVRPPDPLPGNLIGEATDASKGALIGNVKITLTNSQTLTTYSSSTLLPRADNQQTNYDFKDPASGRYLLNPGTWNLSATAAGYVDAPVQNITIDSNQEAVVNFAMVPAPTDANIQIQLANNLNFNASSEINVYKSNSLVDSQKGGNGLDYVVHFQNTDPQCFTVDTVNAYLSGLAGPSPKCAYPFSADGWSSAVTGPQGQCANNWTGDATSDYVCVHPGDQQIVSIPLVNVPTATVTGTVVDLKGTPIPGAVVYATWHDNTAWGNTTTHNDGSFSISVPAEQDMFANNGNYYVKIWAQTNAPYINCCNTPVSSLRKSFVISVGPLHAGDVSPSRPLQLNVSQQAQACANASGQIADAKFQSILDGANVSIESLNQSTDATGAYAFQCADPSSGYRLPAGSSPINVTVAVSKAKYYAYSSAGNAYYRFTVIPLTPNQNNPMPTIDLWPVGQGTITGRVVDAGTMNQTSPLPLPGIRVTLKLGTGAPISENTQADGTFTFVNVTETWPPVGSSVIGNLYYNQTPITYTLTFTDPIGFYNTASKSVLSLQAGNTDNVGDVGLTSSGGM